MLFLFLFVTILIVLKRWYGTMDKSLKMIEDEARKRGIPLILDDGMDFMLDYIYKNNVKSILEIGSAIGWSSMKMALVSSDISVVTIEKDTYRYNEALCNINDMNLGSRISIYNMDACEFETDKKFDLIFIDASKGKNKLFFEKFCNNLTEKGVIITDNLSFHGLVQDDSLIKTKNQRGLVNKIKDYISFLENNTKYVTEFINIGDGISISKKK